MGTQDFSWPFWPVAPLYPYGKRRTLRTEVVPNTVWTFDQLQGIFYVVVPIRMTVVKLEFGGLLVYAPVAPTPECIRLIRELEAKHGKIRYIILPTISGIEHKVFVGPFARKFPQSQVFVAPNQWSFPLSLPLSWLGLPPKRTHILPANSRDTPFASQFDYALLGPIDLKLGHFAEVALFDRQSRTLLVTDSLVCVPEEPPAIIELDPYPLLFHAKDNATDTIADTKANRRKGWQRITLFTFYFRPSTLKVSGVSQALRDAIQAPDHSRKAYFGLFPFQWQANWQQSFTTLRRNGSLSVAPILENLIFNREPNKVRNWVDKVASWKFEQIIPCHLDAPITANSEEFRQAFTCVDLGISPFPNQDLQLLKAIDTGLANWGIIPPAERG